MNPPGLSYDQAPPFNVPLRFFLTAPWFLVLAAALLLWEGPGIVASRWLPATLAFTHLIVLGFMAQVMLGALAQILPVVVGVSIAYPCWIATLIHVPLTLGTLALTGAFPEAFDMLGDNMLNFRDNGPHVMTRDAFQDGIGDVVLARKGMGTSYHLSVVVDDAAQGVTLVTRGQDLFASTWIHVLLQRLLDLETPEYRHHRLIRDEAGKRLAKRDDARSLRELRGQGASPDDIRALVGL